MSRKHEDVNLSNGHRTIHDREFVRLAVGRTVKTLKSSLLGCLSRCSPACSWRVHQDHITTSEDRFVDTLARHTEDFGIPQHANAGEHGEHCTSAEAHIATAGQMKHTPAATQARDVVCCQVVLCGLRQRAVDLHRPDRLKQRGQRHSVVATYSIHSCRNQKAGLKPARGLSAASPNGAQNSSQVVSQAPPQWSSSNLPAPLLQAGRTVQRKLARDSHECRRKRLHTIKWAGPARGCILPRFFGLAAA